MARPPDSFTSCESLISVPRPAMLVAIVTAPAFPASVTISDSRWCIFAFRTLCLMFFIFNILLNNSEISTEVVPTRTGLPAFTKISVSAITALYFSRVVLYTKSSLSSLVIGLLVGITTTSNS